LIAQAAPAELLAVVKKREEFPESTVDY